MDEFERASQQEEAEREIALRRQLDAARTTPSTECTECGVDLEPHRVEFGTCIECKTAQEKRAALYRKG